MSTFILKNGFDQEVNECHMFLRVNMSTNAPSKRPAAPQVTILMYYSQWIYKVIIEPGN